MTVKTTLRFNVRHHQFLSEKLVGQGVFPTQSAAVAGALEKMMHDEEERNVALQALAQEIRARMETLREAFIDSVDAFAAARASVEAARGS
jgi:antitoxin ParD1/3/4